MPGNVQVGATGLVVFGVTMITGVLARGGLLKETPEHAADIALYEEDLRRQYCALTGFSWGILGLALPSLVALLYGTHVYEFVVVVYLLLVAEVTLRSAEAYRREMGQPNGVPATLEGTLG